MARALDAQQKDELVEFLEELYRTSGYTTQAEWARDAAFPQANLSKALSRSNRAGVDGYNLLKLIRAAATRAGARPEEIALARARESGPVSLRVDRRLEALEAKVGELPTADDLGRAVATLQAAIESRATRDIPETQPVKRAGRRGGARS